MRAVWNQSKNYDPANSYTKYPAFAWVHGLNTKAGINTKGYEDKTKGVWYLPSKNELESSYNNTKGENFETFNDALFQNQGNRLSKDSYWSSAEDDDYDAWYVVFNGGTRATAIRTATFGLWLFSLFIYLTIYR